jgi:hypothetical protein
MSLGKHLEEAADRLKAAAYRIDEAREKPASAESLRDWLAALTDQTRALVDLQLLSNESIHEKLHALAEHVGMKGKI